MVHAYLMYGFPTETEQDSIDALERVRQLFAAGCIQSAYWHRFAATAHSPIGLAPEKFGITIADSERQSFHHYINFARQTGAMVGLDVPVIPVEHQYIVTEPHPAILQRHQDGLPEMGVLRESDGSWYMREEAGGLLLGPYEKGAPCCYLDGPRADAEYELFPEDLERLTPHIEAAIKRVPAFGEVGVKQVYNGAIPYTPDGSPIIGPAWGLRNFWLNEGHSFGITAAGGAGWQLAEWIVEGEPTIDMLGVDPRRFGDYATKGYLRAKNEEAYANVFTIHYPDEERAADRLATVRLAAEEALAALRDEGLDGEPFTPEAAVRAALRIQREAGP